MPDVSHVHLVPASCRDVSRGLVGFVSFRLGEVEVDGVTLRRTRDGDLTLSYPSRRDRRGQDHPYLRPRTEAARLHIEARVFEALGLGEEAR